MKDSPDNSNSENGYRIKNVNVNTLSEARWAKHKIYIERNTQFAMSEARWAKHTIYVERSAQFALREGKAKSPSRPPYTSLPRIKIVATSFPV